MNGFIDECILRTSSEDVCGGRLEDARVGREGGGVKPSGRNLFCIDVLTMIDR